MQSTLGDYMFLNAELYMYAQSFDSLCRSLRYVNNYLNSKLVHQVVRFTPVYLGESYECNSTGEPFGIDSNPQPKIPFDGF